MKKHFLAILALFFISAGNLYSWDILAEGKAGYFYPSDNRFRKIYDGNGIYGGEISASIYDKLYAWGSADYFTAHGRSIGGHNRTRVTLIPISFGLKYFYPVSCVDLYLGAGFTRTLLETHDQSPFVIKHVRNWDWGGIVKWGGIINLDHGFFVDLFTNYSFQKTDFKRKDGLVIYRHTADISGWTFGAGVGYRFGPCCDE
jgi:hypothetical protein